MRRGDAGTETTQSETDLPDSYIHYEGSYVEPRGLEPLTSALQRQESRFWAEREVGQAERKSSVERAPEFSGFLGL